MGVSFNQVPVDFRRPGVFVEINELRAVQGLTFPNFRVLFVGQKSAAGAAQAGEVTRVFSGDEARRLFGPGSMLAEMIVTARKADRFNEFWALPLADLAAGVAATGGFTFDAAPAASTTQTFYAGGRRYQILMSAGTAVATLAQRLADEINADPFAVVAAAANLGQTQLTAKHKGSLGNHIDLRMALFAGESAHPNVTVQAMAGGAGDPDIAAALAALGPRHYHHVATPYFDAASMFALEQEFASRWDATRQIEGQIWTAPVAATLAALTAIGDARNSFVSSLIGFKRAPTPPWIIAAAYAAAASSSLEGDNCNRPLRTVLLPDVLPPAEADRFTDDEQEMLLHDGVSTYEAAPDGGVRISRAITTYRNTPTGIPSTAYLDATTPATASFLRQTLRAWFGQRYPRHKLAKDGTNFAPGQFVVTPKIAKGELVAWARELEALAVLQDLDQFKSELIAEIDPASPTRLNAVLSPHLVSPLHQFAFRVDFLL